ncbi:3,4-dihydroxy-2-butanone-4-phosphate synthase [Nocardia callitridis]|uniref:3,4-dihydroxy-2-butanone-4-phosphate synthase n=1 Tax=Nocardia callitridis TaxID=648753 RepID=UPI003CD07E0D
MLTGTTPTQDAHIVLAAEKASIPAVAFLVRYGSGLICAALPGAECDRLRLPDMVGADRGNTGTEYTVSVDAVGPGTGISAADRARTLRLLADSTSGPDAFSRPGHVQPVRAARLGVLERRGAAEATVDLTAIAGLPRAGAFSALVSEDDPTAIATSREAERIAAEHGLCVVSVEDIAIYLRATQGHLQTRFTVVRESEHGQVHCTGYRSAVSGIDYVAYSLDRPIGHTTALVCLDIEDDPAPHLSPNIAAASLAAVAAHGYGTVIVVRNHDGVAHPSDVDADLVEVVRECGYTAPALHNFAPETRTMMWHFGLSIGEPLEAPDNSGTGAGARHSVLPGGLESRRVVGQVVRGDQRGRELGFRTANVELAESNSIADGVWAGRCFLVDGSVVAAAISVGRRPTFYGRGGLRLLEAHLLDFSGDLYGAVIEVHLDQWMRGQTTFASKEELIAALSADVIRTRALIADR